MLVAEDYNSADLGLASVRVEDGTESYGLLLMSQQGTEKFSHYAGMTADALPAAQQVVLARFTGGRQAVLDHIAAGGSGSGAPPVFAAPAPLGDGAPSGAFFQVSSDGSLDSDSDGARDFIEFAESTNPFMRDTDGDGLPDGFELEKDSDPGDPDSQPEPEENIAILHELLHLEVRAGSFEYTYERITCPGNLSGELGVGSYFQESQDIYQQTGDIGEIPTPGSVTGLYNAAIADLGDWVREPLYTKPDGSEKFTRRGYRMFGNHEYYETTNEEDGCTCYVGVAGGGAFEARFVLDASLGQDLEVVFVITDKPLNDENAQLVRTEQVTLPAGDTTSGVVRVEIPPTLDGFRYLYGFPLEVGPEVVAVNSDFDEGIIDGLRGYAVPDSIARTRNGNVTTGAPTLVAERDSPSGRIKKGDAVTDDLYGGFFGIRPLPIDILAQPRISATIQKVPQIDPDTGREETGTVRFWRTQKTADKTFSGEIRISDSNGLPSRINLHRRLQVPGERFWIEGLTPGKCTLEFRLTAPVGELVRFRRTFLVCTQKTKAEWKEEIRQQILLQTTAAGTPVDIGTHHPGNRFRPNIDEVIAIYDYYRQLYCQREGEFMWAGMARVAAGSIYAALADLGVLSDTAAELTGTNIVEIALLLGQSDISEDLVWQHRAYQASGLCALEYANEELLSGSREINLEAWQQIDDGITGLDQQLINTGNRSLLLREQQFVVQPAYNIIRNSQINVIPGVWSFDAPTVLNWFAVNPLPGGSPLSVVVPGGDITNFGDRWAWINEPNEGMLAIWTGSSSIGYTSQRRKNLVTKEIWDAARPFLKNVAEAPKGEK